MLERERLYRLKAQIDEANHRIHQVCQKTDLTLMPFIANEDSVEAGNLCFVTEVVDMAICENFYCSYSYHSADAQYYERAITDATRELNETVKLRDEQMEEFQRAWDRVENHGEGVKVHYGLRTVYIRIPLETICKYKAYIKSGFFETSDFSSKWTAIKRVFGLAMQQPFDIVAPSCDNEILLSYKWFQRGCLSFDNRSDYLGWKVLDYQRSNMARKDLMRFHDDVRGMQFWERANFPDSKAPL